MIEGIVAFGRVLRDHGVRLSVPSVLDALRGLRCVGVERVDDVRTLLRAALITRMEDIPLFERLFKDFWLHPWTQEPDATESDLPARDRDSERPSSADGEPVIAEAGLGESQEREAWLGSAHVMYSRRETLRTQDFKDLAEADDSRMARLIHELIAPLVRRMAVSRRPSQSGTQLDFRRLLRKSAPYGGEMVMFPRVEPRLRVKRLIFLCDVSGSMNPYLRFMLNFIKELQAIPTRVETFVFATRLTRITSILRHVPFPRALSEIAETVRDWSGGTRIGECLAQFASYRGGSLLGSRTVVLLFSDGWDRGDSALLERELHRMHLRCYRVLWLNPLLGSPGYEPTCRGMKTALPYLDSFLSTHNLAGLERVAGTLRGILM
jgi:uncharacterized protein